MNGTKPAVASLTIISSLLSAAFMVAGIFGFAIAPDLQSEINYVVAALLQIPVIYGRLRATKRISL